MTMMTNAINATHSIVNVHDGILSGNTFLLVSLLLETFRLRNVSWHADRHFHFFLFCFVLLQQSNSWHNFKRRHDEPHSQEAVGAIGGALCVGIMLSRSLRAAQRGHVEECKGIRQLCSRCVVPQKNTPVSLCLAVARGIEWF